MIREKIACLILIVIFTISFTSCKKEENTERVIEYSTVQDASGITYRTVKIGDQWWMAENLRAKHFRNGDFIPLISGEGSNEAWANLIAPGRTFALDSLKGFLYNYAVIVDERGIAPEGWRVPTDEDWKKLETYIGMTQSETNSTGWRGTNEAELLASENSLGWGSGILFGKDEFGFNAVPAGCRIHDGRRNLSGKVGFWWTNSMEGDEVWYRYMDSDENRIFRHHIFKEYGMCIRCIKE